MWEMAVGNTFGATALSSYGGFWISFAIILTPGFGIVEALTKTDPHQFYNSMGFFLLAWGIFTAVLTVCTLKSTLAFFLLFFLLDIAFFCLAAGYFLADAKLGPSVGPIKAGGALGVVAAILAWYNALAGIADSSNRYGSMLPNSGFPMLIRIAASSSSRLRTSPGRKRAASSAWPQRRTATSKCKASRHSAAFLFH
jgi:uncharacterized protein